MTSSPTTTNEASVEVIVALLVVDALQRKMGQYVSMLSKGLGTGLSWCPSAN